MAGVGGQIMVLSACSQTYHNLTAARDLHTAPHQVSRTISGRHQHTRGGAVHCCGQALTGCAMMTAMKRSDLLHRPAVAAAGRLQQHRQAHALQLPTVNHWSGLDWAGLLRDRLVYCAADEQAGMPVIGILLPEQLQIYLSLQQAALLQHKHTAAVLQRLAADAACFGMQEIQLHCPPEHGSSLQQLGFQALADEAAAPHDGSAPGRWSLSVRKYLQPWQAELLAMGSALGIDCDYGARHRLRLQATPQQLIDLGHDCLQRPQQATPNTARAWQALQQAAARDGVTLQLVSAWRGYQQQADILQRKLTAGQSLDAILRVSAAPGFSEHHSGCALDLNTPGCPLLETDFANTQAYAWLSEHASAFAFIESYPQHNHHQIAWEPWHWCWRGTSM